MPNKALFTLKIFFSSFFHVNYLLKTFFPPVEFIIFWIGLIVFTWFCLTCSFMPHIFSKWVEQSSGIIRFRLMCSLLEKYFLCNWYYVHSIASLQETHDVWCLLSVNIIVDNSSGVMDLSHTLQKPAWIFCLCFQSHWCSLSRLIILLEALKWWFL